jgi:hypothetical protein
MSEIVCLKRVPQANMRVREREGLFVGVVGGLLTMREERVFFKEKVFGGLKLFVLDGTNEYDQ